MKGRFCAVVVERPKGWSPAGLFDIPVGGRILDVAAICVTADYARHYNQESLDKGGDSWVCLVRQVV